MALTYVNIATTTLTGTQASVVFSSIPSTYTDLAIKVSGRCDSATATRNLYLRYNGSSAANYSFTLINSVVTGAGTIESTRSSASGFLNIRNGLVGDTNTASAFSNVDIYIPSYGVTSNKPASFHSTLPGTTTVISTGALLRSVTDAITSLTLLPDTGNFMSGSTFYLYGIKNS